MSAETEPQADPPRDEADAMSKLVAGSRVTTDTVMRDGGQLTDADRDRIRDRYRSSKARGLVKSDKETARSLGIHKTTLNEIATGTYEEKHTSDRATETLNGVLVKLDRWLSNIEAIAEAPQRGPCADTAVVLEIKTVAQVALLLLTMAVVYGPAGIGKTLALLALLEVMPGSVLVTISDATMSVPQFFRELAATLKLETRGYKAMTRRLICDRLRDTRKLLMIDEAHLADSDVLNAIRQLHDDTGCPVLLCGLPRLTRRIVEGRADDGVGATLFSRVGISRDLMERTRTGKGKPLFSVADVRAVFQDSKIRIAPDGQAWLHDVSNLPELGGLRTASNALRLATHIAQRSKESVTAITAAMLHDATRLLHGMDGARRIANRITRVKGVA